MISNHILQETIEGIKKITGAEFCIINIDGRAIATTDYALDSCVNLAVEFTKSDADAQETGNYHFLKIFDEKELEYILVVFGRTDNLYTIGKLAAFQIQSLVVAYKQRQDKDNFVKNLLLDNYLLVDIFSRAKKLHIEEEQRRVVVYICGDNIQDENALDIMRTNFGGRNNDFVTAVDENSVVIVKQLEYDDEEKEIDTLCEKYYDLLTKKNIKNIRISYGSTVNLLKDVSHSFKEAKMAAEVGSIFFDDRKIIAYSELGIGRLIYQLPIPQCKMFIKEVFGEIDISFFDRETVRTINVLLDSNQNMSEASRELNTHRNTLVYRLNKFQKTTGLDLRCFEDAVVCKIALMILKYMNFVENINY